MNELMKELSILLHFKGDHVSIDSRRAVRGRIVTCEIRPRRCRGERICRIWSRRQFPSRNTLPHTKTLQVTFFY